MPLRVALDTRIPEGVWGGVQQVAIGLAHGLSQLSDGDDRYFFVAYAGESKWLSSFLGENSELLEVPNPGTVLNKIRNRILWAARSDRLRSILAGSLPRSVPETVGAAAVDVVHFTTPNVFDTTAPTIFQPHDLQHVHFPGFFSEEEWKRRDRLYRRYCRRSDMVAVMSRWGREDIVKQYDLPETKVFVIPWAAPVEAYGKPSPESLERIKLKYRLPRRYLLYPAQTWPHKNHVQLLRGLKEAEANAGVEMHLICTGHLNRHIETIRKEIHRLDLDDRARFLGWVPSGDVAGIYALAHGVIFPSLFEGWGMPVMESFHLGIPVTCSRIPVLQEQAGDAALYFDPKDPHEIARGIVALWTDDGLRQRLVTMGSERAAAVSWKRIAEAFRAHYRRLAGQPLDRLDHQLIGLSASGEWFQRVGTSRGEIPL